MIAFVTNSVTPFAEGLCHRAKTSAPFFAHNAKRNIFGTIQFVLKGVGVVRERANTCAKHQKD